VRIGDFGRQCAVALLGAPYREQAAARTTADLKPAARCEAMFHVKHCSETLFLRAEEFLSARTYLIFACLGLFCRS
jgi:hypothetical protein